MFIKFKIANNDKIYFLYIESPIFLSKCRVGEGVKPSKIMLDSSSYLNKI